MSITKKQAYCPECERNVLAEHEEGISDGMGCLLTLLTAGLFFPLWVLLYLINSMKASHCPMCGSATVARVKSQADKARGTWSALLAIVVIALVFWLTGMGAVVADAFRM